MSLVIIGNGAAGLSAVEAIRSVDKNAKVKIVSKNKTTYSLCALPYYISGKLNIKNLSRVAENYYKKINVETLLGKKVVKLVPEKNIIELEDNTKISYKKLLIATGSLPIIPNINGINKQGVYFLDCLKNSEEIKRAAGNIKRAVVIGAGSLGIECAIALRKVGVDVFVIELSDRILPKMLDKELSEIVRKILEENGIKIILREQVLEIVGNKRVEGVRLKTTNSIDCELVVVSIGVKPNIELTKGSGIKTNIGIIVDKRMRTNISNIYAAGDVAESIDLLKGKRAINATWPNAIEQGRIAGYNLANLNKIYEGSKSVNVINIFSVPVVAVGLTSSEVPNYEQIKLKRAKIIKKLILKNNKILGYQAIGTLKNAGLIMSLIYKGVDASKLKNSILLERFAYPLLRY